MQRLLWLALFCLLGIGGLFAARTVVGVTPGSSIAIKAVTADVADVEVAPLARGDRLPSVQSRSIDNALPKTAVDTVTITPTQAPKQSETSKDEIVSWHWHQGGKIVRHRTQ
jgi:hypothetical protein